MVRLHALKIKMERQYFIITMHSRGQKVLITNSIKKNKERNEEFYQRCIFVYCHGPY